MTRSRLKQPAVRSLVHAALLRLGDDSVPLTELAQDATLRGIDFGRIMAACNWLAKRREVLIAIHDLDGYVIIPLAA